MRIQKIKNRGVLFTYATSSEWDLNIYLIMGRKYDYLIDTGLGSLSVVPIRDYIKHDTKPLIVINTHYHWDHIWGNSSLRECMIISHRLCREMIEANWNEMIEKKSCYFDGKVALCLPDLVFENELYFPEDKIRMIYTPGHTIDSISILDEEEKVLHAGDNIEDTVDEIVPDIFSESDYIDTLSVYKKLDFDTCISGHNMVLGKDVIERISLALLKNK